MLVEKINKAQFITLFKTSSRADQFSEEALGAIYDFLEDEQGDNPEAWKIYLAGDIIGLCKAFREVAIIDYYDGGYYEDYYLEIAILSNGNYLLLRDYY